MVKNKNILSLKQKVKLNNKPLLEHWQLYLLVLPMVLYLILFCYKPLYGILIAFKDYKIKLGVWGSPWVGFENFERLFNSYWFPIILKNTLVVSALSLFLGFPLPIILALMVNEIQSGKLRKTFQIVSYAPHFVSMVVVCGMITMFLSPSTGVINQLIVRLGGESFAFMQSETAFKWIYTISGFWQNTGWSSIIYIATLSAVDKSLHEAAEIDGANRFQRIIHINFPVLVPTMVIMLIMRVGQVMSVGFEKVFLLQTDTNLLGSEVISTYVYKQGLQGAQFSFSTAVGLFNSIVNTILLVSVNTISNKISGSGLW